MNVYNLLEARRRAEIVYGCSVIDGFDPKEEVVYSGLDSRTYKVIGVLGPNDYHCPILLLEEGKSAILDGWAMKHGCKEARVLNGVPVGLQQDAKKYDDIDWLLRVEACRLFGADPELVFHHYPIYYEYLPEKGRVGLSAETISKLLSMREYPYARK